jgi:hypothetical protein
MLASDSFPLEGRLGWVFLLLPSGWKAGKGLLERSGEAKKRRHIPVPPKYFAMGTLAHKRIFY